jgi:hypothetical protein
VNGWKAVSTKFDTLARPFTTEEQRASLARTVIDLERAPSVSDLCELLGDIRSPA